MKTWLYHKTEGARVFDLAVDDQQQLHEAGWRDTPAAFSSKESDEPELNRPVPESILDLQKRKPGRKPSK